MMEMKQKYDISAIRVHDIVFAVTSAPDYEMDKAVFIEDYPDYGSLMILSGGHCSCYGFEEVEWDAYIFKPAKGETWKVRNQEVVKLMETWRDKGWGIEPVLAPLVIKYLENSV